MSGAHLPIMEKLMKRVKQEGMRDKLVVVGGVIPNRDIPKLRKLGVTGVFPGGPRSPTSLPLSTNPPGRDRRRPWA